MIIITVRKRILAPVVLQLAQKSPGDFHVGRALLRGMHHPPPPPEYWRCLLQDVICITRLDTVKGWLPTFRYYGPSLKQNSSSFVSEIHTLQKKYWADQKIHLGFLFCFFFFLCSYGKTQVNILANPILLCFSKRRVIRHYSILLPSFLSQF